MTRCHRPAALGLLALLAVGCATAREAGRVPSGDTESGVRVAVFADDDARDAGLVLDESISGVLERKERGGWIPVFRTLEPVWTVAGLSPGRYRVRFDLAHARRRASDGALGRQGRRLGRRCLAGRRRRQIPGCISQRHVQRC